MDDRDQALDDVLGRAGRVAEPEPRVRAALDELQDLTRAPRRGRRRSWIVGGLAAVAVAGTAAGFLTAGIKPVDYWLSTPPFQELPEGWLRTSAYIPVEWTSPDGDVERCRTYLDVENGDGADVDALDAAIEARDWTGFGQSLYDSLPGSPPASSVEGEVSELAQPIIQELATEAIPGLGLPGHPAVAALATTCRTDL